MKRSLLCMVLFAAMVSGCGGNEDSKLPVDSSVAKVCETGATDCEGKALLTCGHDGQFVKTTCNELCGKDGKIHRCMSQAEYDALNKQDVTHACEIGQSKCNGEALEVCHELDGELKFIPQACEVAGYICDDSNGTAHCVPKPQETKCTEGALDCDNDGKKLTCTSGEWIPSACPGEQKCVKHGNPEIVECVDALCVSDPEHCGTEPDPKTGNVSVNISIKNTSSAAITIAPQFRFVLSTEGTGSQYPYNRTDRTTFAEGDTITIESGAIKSYENVEIPGESKQYIGQHFAKESELNGYANNILLYDSNGDSDTIVPEMIDPSTLFTDGGTYEIVYSSEEPQPPTVSEEDIVINLTIRNSSSSAVVLGGDVVFVLANPDKNGKYHGWEGVYNRTEHIYFSQTEVTLEAGTEQTFNQVEAPGLGGRNLLSEELLPQSGRKTNVLLYNPEGESGIIKPQNLSPDIIFENNGSYTIVIP